MEFFLGVYPSYRADECLSNDDDIAYFSFIPSESSRSIMLLAFENTAIK